MRKWNEKSKRSSWRFKEIMEEDTKWKKRLKAERMREAQKMANEMFKEAMKDVKVGKSDQVVP